jgi:hypothetical protein
MLASGYKMLYESFGNISDRTCGAVLQHNYAAPCCKTLLEKLKVILKNGVF